MEKKLIVKEDMICPISNHHCDDECCTVGTECNLSGRQSITSCNKQTAVQWLSDKLCEILGDKCNELTKEQTLQNHYAIKQALQMEREQIEEAFFKGHCDGYNAGVSLYSEVEFQSSDKYYTQTFKP